MCNMTPLEIILIVIALSAVAAMLAVIVAGKKKDRKITELTGDKAALQAKIDAQAEAQMALDEEREAKQRALDAEREERQQALDKERDARQKALDEEREAKQKALDEQREAAQKAIDEQRELAFKQYKEQMDKSLEEMSSKFKALSAENSEHFKEQSKTAVGDLLKPMQDKFDALGKSVHASDEKSAAHHSSMEKMIQLLSDQSKSVGNQAKALADAITGQSKVQGDFGEMLLIDLLRASGLEEGVNFDVQSVLLDDRGYEIKNDKGGTMLPDVIVHYPDGGEVIVDSKVSLKAFVAWNQAVTPEDRTRLAGEHIRSIEQHVTELRDKDYASYIPEGRKKIDYNIMFIPIEGAFQLMQETAPLLWHKAKEEKVLIVSQMSLSVVLNMVLIAWRQHDQQRNIEEVYDTAAELMSAINNWMQTYVKLGEAIKKVEGEYSESTRQLKESNQSVIKKIGKLERLRVAPKRSKAAVKSGGRKGLGKPESIIPPALAPVPDDDEEISEES